MVNNQTTQDHITKAAIDPKSVLVETSANTMDGPTSQQPADSQHVYAQQVTTTTNSPPMAVLPLNPSAKLDQEPNPFEQSFSSVSKTSPGSEKIIKLAPAPIITAPSTTASTSSSVSSINSAHSVTISSNPTTTNNESLKLPPVAAMTSPAGTSVMSSVPKDIASQYAWNSLRAGPLSPSMLQRPTNPDDSAYSNINASSSLLSYQEYPPNSYQAKNESYYPHERRQPTTTKYQNKQQQKSTKRSGVNNNKNNNTITNNNTFSNLTSTTNNTLATSPASPVSPNQRRKLQMDDHDDNDDGENDDDDDDNMRDDDGKVVKKPRTGGEDDEKRKNFLERNRLAALKCRQRKKQWLNNLQAKVEYLTNDNEQLQIQTNSLRDEIMNLKTLLLAHKDCPISQQNNNNGLPTNVNPKAMGAQHQHQQQQHSLLHTTANNGASAAAAAAAAAATTSMAPMYTPRSYNHQSPSANHHHLHQHRLSTSSTGSQPPSGALNMVMVSPHQATAPQSSTVSSSSGVMQF